MMSNSKNGRNEKDLMKNKIKNQKKHALKEIIYLLVNIIIFNLKK
jgi:hypothetical protein